jgi:hypothetical protein
MIGAHGPRAYRVLDKTQRCVYRSAHDVSGAELSATKVTAAQANLATAGLSDHVTILAGDALDPLAGVRGPIGLLLLDGWKEHTLPVLRLLEPRLPPGAPLPGPRPRPGQWLPGRGFRVEDGMEISCRV